MFNLVKKQWDAEVVKVNGDECEYDVFLNDWHNNVFELSISIVNVALILCFLYIAVFISESIFSSIILGILSIALWFIAYISCINYVDDTEYTVVIVKEIVSNENLSDLSKLSNKMEVLLTNGMKIELDSDVWIKEWDMVTIPMKFVRVNFTKSNDSIE